MARTRDYRAEYKRRLARGAKSGLSRPQARGHARYNEAPVKPRATHTNTPAHDESLESALRALRQTGNQARAAKAAGVSPERLRRFLRKNALAERVGKTWRITDARVREMMVISNGEVQIRTLRGFDQASLNGEYLNAVKAFLSSNDIELLAPFAGQSVIDARGTAHPLETNPNKLHRLAHAGSEVFHDVYRLVH